MERYTRTKVVAGPGMPGEFRRSLSGLAVGPRDAVYALGDGEVRVFERADDSRARGRRRSRRPALAWPRMAASASDPPAASTSTATPAPASAGSPQAPETSQPR